MQIVPGSKEEGEFLLAVRSVANKLSSQFRFGYLEAADIKQQIAVFSLEALPRYNKDKGSLYTFLLRHCRNRLINLKRDKCQRHQPPCTCCNSDCRDVGEACCPKYQRWFATNSAKRSLVEPPSGEQIDVQEHYLHSHEDKVMIDEMRKLIDEKLPIEMRADYLKYLAGVKLPKKRKERIVEKLKEILREVNNV